MQFDNEGESNDNCNESQFDLKQHFLKNGLSNRAYLKMSDDIDSGDMNVLTLIECTQNELYTIAKDYNLTVLQTKAFFRAVKSLPGNNNNNNNNNNNESTTTQFVFVSPEDQEFLNDINHFVTLLKNYQKKQCQTKNENKTEMNKILKILKENANKIKNIIDNIVNTIENNVCVFVQNGFNKGSNEQVVLLVEKYMFQ